MSLLKSIFIWWQDQTIGTWLYTARHGSLVGEDGEGNKYYEARKTGRRWVIYNGEIEASRVPPEWHRWLHHTCDEPPTEQPPLVKSWEKAHIPNLTGTVAAYVPPGSLNDQRSRSAATGDYEAWQPE
ncbi:MAG: NADH:ubiquinone oxidoreductase subunit NDUFA12 [Alphaproteobacteria bacterium]